MRKLNILRVNKLEELMASEQPALVELIFNRPDNSRYAQPAVYFGVRFEKDYEFFGVGFEQDYGLYCFVVNHGEYEMPIPQVIQIPHTKLAFKKGSIVVPNNLHEEFFENFNNPENPHHDACLNVLRSKGLTI